MIPSRKTCQRPILFQKLLNTNTSPSSSPPKIPINILIRIPSRRPFNQDYALSRLSNWQKGVDPRKGKLTALSWFRGMETVERNVTVVWSKRFVHTVEGNPVLFSAKTRIVSKGRKRRQRGREGKRERDRECAFVHSKRWNNGGRIGTRTRDMMKMDGKFFFFFLTNETHGAVCSFKSVFLLDAGHPQSLEQHFARNLHRK